MKNYKNLYLYLFLVILLIVFGYAISKPSYNWDLLLYTSAVISKNETNPEVIHYRTYELVRQEVPTSAYKVLVSGKYEEESLKNPAVLQSLVPLAKTRPLYILILSMLSRAGISPVLGTVILSSIGCFWICLLCFVWLSKYFSGLQTFLFSLLMVYVGHFFALARMATPEASSAALLLAATYIIIERKYYYCAFTLFAAAILIRYDNIIFPLVLIIALLLVKREDFTMKKSHAIIGMTLLGITFVGILFYVSGEPLKFILSQMFLGVFSQGSSAQSGNSYSAQINRFLLDLKMVPSHIFFFLVPILGFVILNRISKTASNFGVYFWSTLTALFIRIALFPSIEIRFYVFYLTLICLLFLVEWGKVNSSRTIKSKVIEIQ